MSGATSSIMCHEHAPEAFDVAILFEPRTEAPWWLVDAVQNNPCALRSALAADPQLLLRHYFSVLAGRYIVELDYCALLGSHAAEALVLLLAATTVGPPHWRTPFHYESLLTSMVAASYESGLHTVEARALVTHVGRNCPRDVRTRMLLLAMDFGRTCMSYALVHAGAELPRAASAASASLYPRLVAYRDALAQQRAALVVLVGLQRFRLGPFARGAWLEGMPVQVLRDAIARYVWDVLVAAGNPTQIMDREATKKRRILVVDSGE